MQNFIDVIEEKAYLRAKMEFAEEKIKLEMQVAKLQQENASLHTELQKFKSSKVNKISSKTVNTQPALSLNFKVDNEKLAIKPDYRVDFEIENLFNQTTYSCSKFRDGKTNPRFVRVTKAYQHIRPKCSVFDPLTNTFSDALMGHVKSSYNYWVQKVGRNEAEATTKGLLQAFAIEGMRITVYTPSIMNRTMEYAKDAFERQFPCSTVSVSVLSSNNNIPSSKNNLPSSKISDLVPSSKFQSVETNLERIQSSKRQQPNAATDETSAKRPNYDFADLRQLLAAGETERKMTDKIKVSDARPYKPVIDLDEEEQLDYDE